MDILKSANKTASQPSFIDMVQIIHQPFIMSIVCSPSVCLRKKTPKLPYEKTPSSIIQKEKFQSCFQEVCLCL